MSLKGLDRWTAQGAALLDLNEPTSAHSAFNSWVYNVAQWLNEGFPNTGLSAQWAARGSSNLVTSSGGVTIGHPSMFSTFYIVVQGRLQWLGNLPNAVRLIELSQSIDKQITTPHPSQIAGQIYQDNIKRRELKTTAIAVPDISSEKLKPYLNDQKRPRDDTPKDVKTRKKEIIRDLIKQDKNFRFCGPSDDPDEQTSVTVGYQYLITQIKNLARPFLPEPIASSLAKINVEVNNIYSVYEAQSLLHALLPDIEDALENPKMSEGKVSDNPKNPYWIEFSDASGEVVLNGLFTVAKPETNGQNYKIIKYLIGNPNKFVTADDLKANALGGKNLDKRLTDFAAQINMNKDLGKLFFDTGNDSIRLNNPVTPERMTEQNIRRVRIKPA